MKNTALFDYLEEKTGYSRVPVLVSTTFDVLAEVMKEVGKRATDYTAIPFNMEMIRIRIDNVLNAFKSFENSMDIVERQKETERKKFELVLGNSDLRYWEYNIKTKQLYRSSRVVSEVGYSPITENVPDVFIDSGIAIEETLPEYKRLYDDVRSGKDSYAVFKFRNEDGTVDWMEISYTVLFDADGNPDKAMGIGRNVTDSVHQKRELDISRNTLRLVRELVGADNLSDALDSVLTHISQYYDADRAYIFRLSSDNYFPRALYYKYRNDSRKYSDSLEGGDSAVVKAHIDYWKYKLEGKEYLHLCGEEIYENTTLTDSSGKSPEELLVVPIKVEGKLVAMLGVDNPHSYNGDAYLLLSSVYFISSELIKRRNIARMEYDLTHDDLTGIYNRHKFYTSVAQLLADDPEG